MRQGQFKKYKYNQGWHFKSRGCWKILRTKKGGQKQ
jgi:hypothetical protein